MRILVAGPPKTGNIWVEQILATIYNLSKLSGKHLPKFDISSFIDFVERGLFIDDSIFHQHFSFSNDLCYLCSMIDCQIVTVIRDPYDAFVSLFYYIQRFSDQFAAIGGLNAQAIGKDIDHPIVIDILRVTFRRYLILANDWVRSGRSIVVRYEQLHDDAFHEVKAVTDRIRPVPNAAINEAIAACTADNMRKEGGYMQMHIRSASVGDWRNHLTAAHLEVFRSDLADLVVGLGYRVVEPDTIQGAVARDSSAGRTHAETGIPRG